MATDRAGRGRWDRRQTAAARRDAQRRRLLAAAAEAASQGQPVTTTRLVTSAGVGRNTFYEHFENVGAALLEVERAIAGALGHNLEAATREARTPLERLRRLAAAWTETIGAHPESARVFGSEGAGAESAQGVLRMQLREALAAARRAGLLSAPPDPLRFELAVGTFEWAAMHLSRHPEDANRTAALLVDVLVRAFR